MNNRNKDVFSLVLLILMFLIAIPICLRLAASPIADQSLAYQSNPTIIGSGYWRQGPVPAGVPVVGLWMDGNEHSVKLVIRSDQDCLQELGRPGMVNQALSEPSFWVDIPRAQP